MQLMRLAEVPTSQRDRVFRHSPARALWVGVGIVCASAGLVMLGWYQGSGLTYYVAGALLVSLLVMHKFILARFQPSNWLARMNDEGLFLQFRSYLNHHFPEQDLTVAFIPYREIRTARQVDERRETPYRDLDQPLAEKSTQRHRRLVEFELAGDATSLEKALVDERAKHPPNATLYKDYPVRLSSPTCVQVVWNVIPGAEVFLDALRQYTNIAAPAEKSQDYVHLEKQSREEQEKRLLELVEAGRTIDAIYIARKLYFYDLTQARAFVEGLCSGKM